MGTPGKVGFDPLLRLPNTATMAISDAYPALERRKADRLQVPADHALSPWLRFVVRAARRDHSEVFT